jgi:protein ImuA
VVVADGSRLTLNETRRLQLAAEAGGALGLLLRPAHEIQELSAARTRWRVGPALSADSDQRWTVDLLRCKGLRPTESGARRWAVQRSHATGDVRVAPEAADRPLSAADAPRRRAL